MIKEGNRYFDVFDIRLYGNIYTIPARIELIRKKLVDAGARKPIICTEYHGPGLFEFPENRKYVGMMGAWTQSITNQGNAEQSTNLTRTQQQAVKDLYNNMSKLCLKRRCSWSAAPRIWKTDFSESLAGNW